MSIENIDHLITFLTNFRKQVDNNGFLNPIERDILKKELLHFYQNIYLNDSTDLEVKSELVSNIVSSPNETKEVIIEPKVELISTPFQNEVITEPIIDNIITKDVAIEHKEIEVPKTIEPIIENNAPVNFSNIEAQKEKIIVENKNSIFSEPIANENIGLNEKLNNNNNSLNERFQTNSSVSDRLSIKNKSINEMIDLNKRLLFVDVLFKGNSQLFNQVIQHIDEYKSADEAIKFLEFNKEKLDLNEKKESVYNTLLDLINKKFS